MSDPGGLGVPGAADARLLGLPAIHAAILQTLTDAVADRRHAWRTGALATIDGERADARTVVLRGFDRGARRLLFYTDARSPKVAQVAARPHGTVLLWSPLLGWQLRLSVDLTAQTEGAERASHWAGVAATPAVRDYIGPLAPGQPLPACEGAAGGASQRNTGATSVTGADSHDPIDSVGLDEPNDLIGFGGSNNPNNSTESNDPGKSNHSPRSAEPADSSRPADSTRAHGTSKHPEGAGTLQEADDRAGCRTPEPLQPPAGWFALLGATITSIDWLELHALGHRRAVFDAAGGRWLAP